jgi:hypothetical protein
VILLLYVWGRTTQISTLSSIGLTLDQLNTMVAWSKSRTVSLRFRADEKCSFAREVKRDVESATKRVTETTMFGSMTSKVSAGAQSLQQ